MDHAKPVSDANKAYQQRTSSQEYTGSTHFSSRHGEIDARLKTKFQWLQI